MPDNNERLLLEKDGSARESLKKRQNGIKEENRTGRSDMDALARAASNPLTASPAAVAMLQRTVGNASVMRMIQRKLSVGAAADSSETEADQIAGQVMSMPEPDEDHGIEDMAPGGMHVMRRNAAGSGDKPEAQDLSGSFDVDRESESRLNAGRGGGAPLEGETRAFMEPRFGADFSGVRIHADSEAAELSRKFSANAFTLGHDIYMNTGMYNPGSEKGKRLLAHELTHVVQQTGEGQRPGVSMMRRSTGRGRIQRDIAGVTKLVEDNATKDEKEGLKSFYMGLSDDQKKIAAQYVIKKGKVAKGDKVPDDVDDKAFKKEILSYFRSKFDWDVFSDAIRFAKSVTTPTASSEDVSPMGKTGGTSLGSTVLGAATSMSGKISDWSGAAQSATQVVGSVGSGLGALGSVVGAGAQAMNYYSEGPLSATMHTERLTSITGNLTDTGRGISTAVQAADVAKGAVEASASTAATTAAGALAVIAGAVYLVNGITNFFASRSREGNLEKMADSRGNELEQREADLRKQEANLTEVKRTRAIANGFGLTHARNDEERQRIQTKIAEFDVQITAAQQKVDQEKRTIEELKRLVLAAQLGASTQNMNKHAGAATAAKGALMVAGGALVIAAASNPIGWGLLIAAGIVGGVMAIVNWYRRKRRKTEIVDKYLNLDKLLEDNVAKDSERDKVRDQQLQARGFNSVDQCYMSIVRELAEDVFDKGVKHRNDPANADYKQLVENLGLTIKDDENPTVDQIAKKLHV